LTTLRSNLRFLWGNQTKQALVAVLDAETEEDKE